MQAGGFDMNLYDEIKFLVSHKKKAFYIGWHGHRNLGDEVLLKAYKELFGEKITFYTKSYLGKSVKYFLNNSFDYVFLGGGTLINRGGDYLNKLKTLNTKKKVVFGTGVANPEFWTAIPGSYSAISEWVNELNTCDYIGVRGPLSKRLLTDWGVNKKVNVVGDPVLIFMRQHIFTKKRNKVVGVNVGFTNGQLWGGDDDRFICKLIRELKVLGSKGWSFKFFPVYYKDIDFIFKVMRMLKDYPVDYVEKYTDPNVFMHELNSVDVFIGEKLHSVVLAICTHTPSIMLEYRPKCRDFMMSLGMSHLNIRTDQIIQHQIVDIVEALYENLDNEQRKIDEKCNIIKKELIIEAEKICQLYS